MTQAGYAGWQPPIDIVETPNALNILVAMPGVAPKQVQVILDTGALLIRGERSLPEFAERGEGVLQACRRQLYAGS